MSEDGRSIFLASAIVNGDDETGILSIREIRIADEDFGKTMCRFEIGIPWFEMMSLALQGSYVALTTHEECFLVNWRDNVGICFSMRASGVEGVEHDFRTEPYRCSFHPNDPVIFVFDDLCKSRISIIDVPDDMPRLTHKMSSLQEHWTPGNIQAREERAIMLPIPENLDCKVFQSGFRAISRSLIVLDLLVVAPEDQTFSFIDMFNLPRTIYTRHSVDTSCWTLQTEFTRFNTPALKTPEFRLMNTQIRPGVFFIMLLVGQTRTLIVPKFSEGYRNLYSWARIALPRYLAEKTRTDGREIMVPTCFDLRSGKLLAFLPDGLHVVQY
ncbi:hypothetical protein SISNIDRAFT_455441 [Sistotremastrum niveocremeum HHB9708]|uniref:Cleavage/polyadenylation specificity factor A subunit N-terminal domain-containing protein n=1 Tax=Sistotremastrum niveocremeum HHB9708 TaxID=1314777 RepID=A0A164U0Z3_9AGAM|nr:hypothetical protein SISNIDRAFT_455441 [Sistotremastrum niveocremeum HHB9708]